MPLLPVCDRGLVPHRTHRQLAVRARDPPVVPPGQVREHRVPLQTQPLPERRGVQDLAAFRHFYSVYVFLLDHIRKHTEIMDYPAGFVNKLCTIEAGCETMRVPDKET